MKRKVKDMLSGITMCFGLFSIAAAGGCIDGDSFKLALFFVTCTIGSFYGVFKLNEDSIMDQLD